METLNLSYVYADRDGCDEYMRAGSLKTSLPARLYIYTRGIWKVLSMVLYLSNRFTNPIMFGIILKSYVSSMLWHKFHEDSKMQTRKILL